MARLSLDILICCCFFYIFYTVSIFEAFNLETRLPAIKIGNNGSYFGYSIALHQYRENNKVHSLLLVGAPLDNNLQPNTSRSGALFSCQLNNKVNDCEQVITDGRRDLKDQTYSSQKDIDNDQLLPPGKDERKDEQWLGVTVRSQRQGGKVMVCAHRYLTETFWLKGLCYILDKNLKFDLAFEPCRGKSSSNAVDYGYCQVGTSGVIADDDNVVVGSPGTMNWKGSLYVTNISDDFLNRDKHIYMGNWSAIDDNIIEYGYLGMSITAGHFYGNTTTVYAAGAPRANGTGKVVLFQKVDHLFAIYLKIYSVIDGEQFGSNFGYEIATADVNGDKDPDLIIAAPFYFKDEAGGAVYVYLNNPKHCFTCNPPLKLTGKQESRFGFAVASLGDLNLDGYDDIAIGAPYEGNGVVYIYLGSRDGLLKDPCQTISSESIRRVPISTFGYSLSGGLDIDSNGYPDLAIGAFDSDTVVVLRSRPIVEFTTFIKEGQISNIDLNNRKCPIGNNFISCFSFETCCIVKSESGLSGNQKINLRLEAETFIPEVKYSRIRFNSSTAKNGNIVLKTFSIPTNTTSCQEHTAYIKETTQDVQTPIKMKMEYSLVIEPLVNYSDEFVSLDRYPILNQQEAVKTFEATFLNDCGNDSICESELSLKAELLLEHHGVDPNEYKLILGQHGTVFMNISVNNTKESAYETHLYVKFPQQIDFGKQTPPAPGNRKYTCTLLDHYVKCDLGNPLKMDELVNIQLEFDLRKLNVVDIKLEFDVFVNTTSRNYNTEDSLKLALFVEEKILLSITGSSSQPDVSEMVNVQLKGESAMKYKDEIGNKVVHKYAIVNDGFWVASNVRVEFEWPYQVASNHPEGKWLLYMDEFPYSEGGGKCQLSDSQVNPLHLLSRKTDETKAKTTSTKTSWDGKSDTTDKSNSSAAIRNRVKREVETTVSAETYTTKNGKKLKVVKMNCLLNTAKCFKFYCDFSSIPSRQIAVVTIKSRLWDATLLEDYADIDEIRISSRAKIHVNSAEAMAETIVKMNMDKQGVSEPIPLYIIIAAIIIGLLLFILLTLCLWKVGFFKRRRPDPTLSGNLEKHRLEDSYHDYQ